MLKTWRVVGPVALLATCLLTGGGAARAADEPEPGLNREALLDAVRESARPVGDGAAMKAEIDKAAGAAGDVGAAALPSDLCYTSQRFGDANEANDSLLDAVNYAMGLDCRTSTYILDITTADSWSATNLGWVDLGINSDGNLGNGCEGADWVAIVFYEPGVGLLGGFFRMPSCNSDTWTDTGIVPGFFKPAGNVAQLYLPTTNFLASPSIQWQSTITHLNFDDPVDFLPDGAMTTGHYRTSPGAHPCAGRCFFLTNGTTGGTAEIAFRDYEPANEILVGDWDGDGVDSFGFRKGVSYVLKNAHAPTAPDYAFNYGAASDKVLVGDWDGNGTDTLAVRRGNTYHIRNSLGSGPADLVASYGTGSDVVLVGDWDGDGDDTLAVRRGNTYYLKNTIAGGNADAVVAYGRANDVVLVGDWNADGVDTLAVRRGNAYFLKNVIAGGNADITFNFGRANDITFVGDWNSDGADSLGVRR
jgi:hypothetical protein